MLEQKEIDIEGKKYLIHKFPAWQGILLVGRIPQAMSFTQENLQASGEVWAEVFSYIAVPTPKGGSPLF